MKIIEKKIKHNFLKDIYLGRKTFELRKEDDVIYEENDILFLRSVNENGVLIEDEYLVCQITYVLRNYEGLQDGYVILGIKILDVR